MQPKLKYDQYDQKGPMWPIQLEIPNINHASKENQYDQKEPLWSIKPRITNTTYYRANTINTTRNKTKEFSANLLNFDLDFWGHYNIC